MLRVMMDLHFETPRGAARDLDFRAGLMVLDDLLARPCPEAARVRQAYPFCVTVSNLCSNRAPQWFYGLLVSKHD